MGRGEMLAGGVKCSEVYLTEIMLKFAVYMAVWFITFFHILLVVLLSLNVWMYILYASV